MGLKNAAKARAMTTPEQRTAWARNAALAKHRKLGHKMTGDNPSPTTKGAA